MPHGAEADRCLESLGFRLAGRFWVLPGSDVFLEAPGSELEPSRDGFETIETRSGRLVRIHSGQEVLLQRLADFAATGSASAFQQCLWLVGSAGVDQRLLERRAHEERLDGALTALRDAVATFHETGRLPTSWELKDLAKEL
jgi:hypothetical protein